MKEKGVKSEGESGLTTGGRKRENRNKRNMRIGLARTWLAKPFII